MKKKRVINTGKLVNPPETQPDFGVWLRTGKEEWLMKMSKPKVIVVRPVVWSSYAEVSKQPKNGINVVTVHHHKTVLFRTTNQTAVQKHKRPGQLHTHITGP